MNEERVREIIVSGDGELILDSLLSVLGDSEDPLTLLEGAGQKLKKAIDRRKAVSHASSAYERSPTRCVIENLQCIQPRGKFTMTLTDDSIFFAKSGASSSSDETLQVSLRHVRYVLRFPKPDPYKTDKAGNAQNLLISFSEPVGKSKVRPSNP